MKMIVGLGNPGKEYENTRHNMGFMVIDNFAKGVSAPSYKSKFNGLYSEVFVGDEKVILLKPMSFMNLSGNVVLSFANYFKISSDDILVVSDDLDLPFLKYRLRLFGSCGGHNGLRDIEKSLGTSKFKRFRIGISSPVGMSSVDYVLGRFSKDDLDQINEFLPRFFDILTDFCFMEFDKLMSKYN